MGEISICLLQEVDTEKLYKFELYNRVFLKAWLPQEEIAIMNGKISKKLLQNWLKNKKKDLFICI